jgi:Kef-type K+ transport system membrane component KefB
MMPFHRPRTEGGLMSDLPRRAPRATAWACAAVALAAGIGLAPPLAWAMGVEGHPRFGPVLFALGVLVVAAKAGGLLAERWGQPSVLGELVVGIGLGNFLPPLFGEQGIRFVQLDPTLRLLAEVGVLILLFDVGLEADLRALVRVGRSSALVAVIGVGGPFVLGWAAVRWLLPESPGVVPVFVGATLTATSVGITARVLKDLRATQRAEAQMILGAAIIDDVLGLMILAVVTGFVQAGGAAGSAPSGLALAGILLKAVLFLGLTIGLGHWLSGPIVRLVGRTGHPGMLLIVGLALCFTFAFVAERIGLAGIIGAFAAGLFLDPYGQGVRTRAETATLAELLGPLSELFVPLFFVLIGIQVDLPSLADPVALSLGVVLVVAAIAGKLACALGVLDRGVDRLAVAIGMIPRGEVGLIFAGIGASLMLDRQPLLSQGVYSASVFMVVITTLMTPIGLRWAFGRRAARDA